MYFCMVAYSKRCCIISFTIWSYEMKGAGTVGSIHLIQSILVLTLQRVYLSPDLSHVLFELTFIHYCKKKQQNIQASHPIFKCFKHILICGVQLPSPSPSEGRWNEQMKERQRDTWKRVNNYMPPINLMKLWKKWGRFLFFFFLFFFLRLLEALWCLPSHLTEKPNDLFESQLAAPGWQAWIGKQWGKQAQPGVHGGVMGTESQSQPAWHSERCERCPSLPLMHPGVVDWFFFCAEAGVLMS